MTDQPIRAAAYTRVSTDEQAEHGYSIDEQERRCLAIIERHSWEHVGTYRDAGFSGSDPNRPAYRQLLDAVTDGKIDRVVIVALDRFGRDAGELRAALLLMDAAGVQLVSEREHIDRTTPEGRLQTGILGEFAEFEKEKIRARTRSALAARARAGLATPAYGYVSQDKGLVLVPAEADVVRRILDEWINGVTQRAIARALDADGFRTRRGGRWTQGAVGKIIANPLYKGWFRFNGDVLKGTHEPIVSEAVWEQAQQVLAVPMRRTGGRWPDGPHLLVKRMLRCGRCGYAMIPRKGRPGGGRDRYECRGRVEHGPGFCAQPSIRRELVDVPFLANLTDHYIDFAAARERIAQRASSDLRMAHEAVTQNEQEVQRSEARLARIQRGWQDGVLDDDDYAAQRDQVTGELDGARAALERSTAHVERITQTGVSTDAERQLLDLLAEVKRAVADGVSRAPNLNALRNVIGQLFESVELVQGRSPDVIGAGHLDVGDNLVITRPWPDLVKPPRQLPYVLLPRLRSTPSPTGQLTPVGCAEQYPPTTGNPFFARYCWW